MLTNEQAKASVELACGLTAEVVRTFGEVRLRVLGTSMAPSILPGDCVSIHHAGLREISMGDVVLYSRKGRLFVHRVVGRKIELAAQGVEELSLITRGDRLRHDDPPVSPAELLGRVVSIKRNNRDIQATATQSNRQITRLLQASDHATFLYLRLASCWRSIFWGRTKCQAL